MKNFVSILALACATTAIQGCANRLDHIGNAPSMSAPGAPRTPLPATSPERLALANHIDPKKSEPGSAGSLWRSGPSSLFGDRRARTLGDILTVVIEIDEEAEIKNRTDRSRNANEGLSIPNFFGLEGLAANVLPDGGSLNPAIDATSTSSNSGDGNIKREEKLALQVAATVVNVLPNGHMVISGNQEVRVNHELRDLQVLGIIRPEDISRRNTITYEKIADARIVYGGRGIISDVQQPRYGQKVLDAILPY
ncbi:MAG: flagellar L-ring protein [Hyphococcus sp.]|nr:MAG: flagellar L-ring protein [Marinicaulis sp.]